MNRNQKTGLISIIGSGEISPTGRNFHEYVFKKLVPPIKVSILETPAGFQLNSFLVAKEIADFITFHLQNYKPQVTIVSETCESLLSSNYIFAGPGSPTYAVKKLKNSLCLKHILERLKNGAALSIASAASVAFGKFSIPVYEIFKVGDDPKWVMGLDIFKAFGLSFSIVPHWNNNQGGKNLDTSRCFVGQKRYEILKSQLPEKHKILGIDEHTAVIIDINNNTCNVLGKGKAHIETIQFSESFESGSTFPLQKLKNLS